MARHINEIQHSKTERKIIREEVLKLSRRIPIVAYHTAELEAKTHLVVDGEGAGVHLVGCVVRCPVCLQEDSFNKVILPGERPALSCGCDTHSIGYNPAMLFYL